MTTITELKTATRNQYGDLVVDFEQAIKTAYPGITIETSKPGCWGHLGRIFLSESCLTVPDGRYSSNKHNHTAGHSIIDIENARDCKLNLAGKPLFLLSGRAFNGDYRSLTKTYYLFGQNEDGSYFLHRIRPSAGKNLDTARAWVWSLKQGEEVKARQGDLAFIPKRKPSGSKTDGVEVRFGNHAVRADEIRQTKGGKTYCLNPIANHGEHHTVQAQGWFELRLGRAWEGGSNGNAD